MFFYDSIAMYLPIEFRSLYFFNVIAIENFICFLEFSTKACSKYLILSYFSLEYYSLCVTGQLPISMNIKFSYN